MLGLNAAFERLRSVIPRLQSERRLSKSETLQMAQIYIGTLSEMLQDTAESPENAEAEDGVERDSGEEKPLRHEQEGTPDFWERSNGVK